MFRVSSACRFTFAEFRAKSGFDGTTLKFSANATGNVVGHTSVFDFGSQSVRLLKATGIPEVSIADAPTVVEGSDAVFTVSLSETPTVAVTVKYSTAAGKAGTSDYTAATSPNSDIRCR